MGKASKKLNRKKQQKTNAAALTANREAERKFDECYNDGKYAEALNYLAEMIQGQDINPEYLYKGAECYYMQSDYERAAQWIYNTLNFAPTHVDAKILLARICCQQARQDDGFAILDGVVKNNNGSLSDIQQEKIEEIVGVSSRNDRDRFIAAYPALAGLLNLDKQTPQAADDTLSALQKLKDKLKAMDKGEMASKSVPQPKEEKVSDDDSSRSAFVQDSIRQVKAKQVSIAEKIRLYNSFAGAAYVEDDFAGAEQLLKEALLLDDRDEVSIRNLAVVFAAQGDKQKALATAAQLTVTDFLLLKTIKAM